MTPLVGFSLANDDDSITVPQNVATVRNHGTSVAEHSAIALENADRAASERRAVPLKKRLQTRAIYCSAPRKTSHTEAAEAIICQRGSRQGRRRGIVRVRLLRKLAPAARRRFVFIMWPLGKTSHRGLRLSNTRDSRRHRYQ